jgi:hypothetical protein
MQSERTICGSYAADRVLIDKDITMHFHENGEVVEGLDVPLHLLTGHELDNDLDPFLARLIEILVLDIEWRFRHGPLL